MCLDDRDAITDKTVADQFGVGLERPSPLHRLHPTPLSPQPPFFSVASQHSPTPYPTPASQLPFIFPFFKADGDINRLKVPQHTSTFNTDWLSES